MHHIAIAHFPDGSTEEYEVAHLSPQKPSHLQYVIENDLKQHGVEFTSVEIVER